MTIDGVSKLRDLISGCGHIVGFTGAGISTESGIPDYRSKGGIWDRFQPVYIQEFLTDRTKRRLYWERKAEMWPAIAAARPGAGHRFFRQLQQKGKLEGVVTQNIDGLHERSGVDPGRIVNLHGTSLEIVCMSCGRTTPTQEYFPRFDPEIDPLCDDCGGFLKPNTISFGQSLDPSSLQRADALASACDLMIVMGSTLVVHPAAGIPMTALRCGATLAIVTISGTPLDALAEVVVNAPIGEVVPGLL